MQWFNKQMSGCSNMKQFFTVPSTQSCFLRKKHWKLTNDGNVQGNVNVNRNSNTLRAVRHVKRAYLAIAYVWLLKRFVCEVWQSCFSCIEYAFTAIQSYCANFYMSLCKNAPQALTMYIITEISVWYKRNWNYCWKKHRQLEHMNPGLADEVQFKEVLHNEDQQETKHQIIHSSTI